MRRAEQLNRSLVVDDSGTIVGHVAVSPVSLSDGSAGWHGLGFVSVLPARQREGISSRLIRQVLDILGQQGTVGCVVLGDPNYYGRFGFGAIPSFVLPGVPLEYFQVRAFYGSFPNASISYDEAFDVKEPCD